MVFRALFLFEVHAQQRKYLTGGNSSGGNFWKKVLHVAVFLQSGVLYGNKPFKDL